jgi:hypothetical protein
VGPSWERKIARVKIKNSHPAPSTAAADLQVPNQAQAAETLGLVLENTLAVEN